MIGESSRYAGCVLYIDGTDEFIGNRSRIDNSSQPDDVFHVVQAGDRVDILAYRYLGDPTLWWVICDYNDIFFPLDLELGMVLRIPSVERVAMELLE
ncbi:MAG: LysM peptidoglycan-binding domain-containing protein [Armatimonadota bacterium]